MAETSKKALFFDVDGTLMNEKGEVPESAKSALSEARKNGHLVFVNSGRVYPMAAEMEQHLDFDGLLCGCGTDLYLNGENLYCYLLPEALQKALCEDYKAYNVDLFFEGPEGVMAAPGAKRPDALSTIEFVAAQNGFAKYKFGDPNYRASKFCIQFDEESDINGFVERYKEAIHFIDRGNGFYECVPHGHGKGFAVEKVLELCGIKREDSYGFGDSTNDTDMLLSVGHAVIMERHDKPIEPYAEYITTDIDADGIANALKHYGLIA